FSALFFRVNCRIPTDRPSRPADRTWATTKYVSDTWKSSGGDARMTPVGTAIRNVINDYASFARSSWTCTATHSDPGSEDQDSGVPAVVPEFPTAHDGREHDERDPEDREHRGADEQAQNRESI